MFLSPSTSFAHARGCIRCRLHATLVGFKAARSKRLFVPERVYRVGGGGIGGATPSITQRRGLAGSSRGGAVKEMTEFGKLNTGKRQFSTAHGEDPSVEVLQESDDGVWKMETGDADHGEVEGELITSAELNDDTRLLEDLRAAQMGYALEAQDETAQLDSGTEGDHTRTHALTLTNRFTTTPSTLLLPQDRVLDPIASQLADVSATHLSEAAHRIFGGTGLPHSTSTPALGKTMQQKAIPLEASQSKMSEMDGNVFMATLLPGIYVAITSVLVETRKRLGTEWAESLVEKAARGDLRILDAGGAGAGVLAVRELLRAEWERMHEATSTLVAGVALSPADGKLGGMGLTPPLGIATVLTGSDALRHRASRLLDDTTFIPRLPDYVHTEEAKKKGKFDIVIAPHTLWPLREDYLRKAHVDNLWSMLSKEGGVLLILEKGVARGFEVVAGAREMLLNSRIASAQPTQATEHDELDQNKPVQKEIGSIIAPCTNHFSCPMYKPQGLVKGRREICHFSQRYIRTPAQQRILGAKDKNFEDVKSSYLSVQRGRDIRVEHGIRQDETATQTAFAGYGSATSPEAVSSLALPRAVLPPLKRRGHVILDFCTPAGTLERWTVPRSFSKQAFRDARKSSWGDLWALGAKTRVMRTVRMKKARPTEDINSNEGKDEPALEILDEEYDNNDEEEPFDHRAAEDLRRQIASVGEGGRTRGRKIKGIRDKRDKKGDGRGRRKRAGAVDPDDGL